MSAAYDGILALLEEQMLIYEDLLAISEIKQNELVKGSLEALDSLTRREESLVYQAGRLEEERFRRTKEITEAIGLTTDASINEVFQSASKKQQDRMEDLRGRLSGTLGKLEKINHENMSLLQQTLRMLNYTMETIAQEDKITYSPDEGKMGTQKSLLLDRRI